MSATLWVAVFLAPTATNAKAARDLALPVNPKAAPAQRAAAEIREAADAATAKIEGKP